MTALSDTQLVILSAAARREDRNVLPLPGSLRGGAAAKVVCALLKRGQIAETTTDSQTKADAALNRIWRNDEDGRAILLHITDAGLAAIGAARDHHGIVLTGGVGHVAGAQHGDDLAVGQNRQRPLVVPFTADGVITDRRKVLPHTAAVA